jgi:hypothetical protein
MLTVYFAISSDFLSQFGDRLPATTAATARTTTAAAVSTTLLRLGFVDLHWSAIVVDTIKTIYRRMGFRVSAHFDEAETLALAGVTVGDNLAGFHSAELSQFLCQSFLGYGKR